jgi:hypothetical protein
VKERCKDIVGKRVRLLCDIQTRGGVKFPKGLEMACDGTWRGTFDLFASERPMGQRTILKVSRREFEVLR